MGFTCVVVFSRYCQKESDGDQGGPSDRSLKSSFRRLKPGRRWQARPPSPAKEAGSRQASVQNLSLALTLLSPHRVRGFMFQLQPPPPYSTLNTLSRRGLHEKKPPKLIYSRLRLRRALADWCRFSDVKILSTIDFPRPQLPDWLPNWRHLRNEQATDAPHSERLQRAISNNMTNNMKYNSPTGAIFKRSCCATLRKNSKYQII